MAKFLRLNIGGKSYRLLESTAKNRCRPSLISRLAALAHEDRLMLADCFLDDSREYFFERSAHVFDAIYDFYATGFLHPPLDVCSERFSTELDFWQIPKMYISVCCIAGQHGKTMTSTLSSFDQTLCSTDDEDTQQQQHQKSIVAETLLVVDDPFASVKCAPGIRRLVTRFFEEPSSSLPARIYSLFTIALIFTSVIGLIVGSLPDLQQADGTPIDPLEYTEIGCIAWFTADVAVRFLISPQKLRFLRIPLNLIDVLTVIPFYVNVVLQLGGMNIDKMHNVHITGVLMVVRLLRVLRVIRLFKLARYSKGLKLLGITLQHSMKELGFLMIFLAVGVVFFSTVIHVLEKDEIGTKFDSIPASAWWCVVTMTTIGYGDMVPITIGGKLIASAASVCGIIVLAFPISMIVDNFSRQQFVRRRKKVRRALLKARAMNDQLGGRGTTTATAIANARRSTSVTSTSAISNRLLPNAAPRHSSALSNGTIRLIVSDTQLQVPEKM